MSENEEGGAGLQAQDGDSEPVTISGDAIVHGTITSKPDAASETAPPPDTPYPTPAPAASAPVPSGVTHINRARSLPELAKDEAAELINEGIQAFKDLGGRTMLVVHRAGQLFKKEK